MHPVNCTLLQFPASEACSDHIVLHRNTKQYKCIFQVSPASRENVAAHAEVLRGGEERQGPGGGARQEGAAVQTTGQSGVRH